MELGTVAMLVIVLLYFAGLFWIGVAASKRVGTMKDYFVAGKGLNFWLVSFSSRATGESGWLLLGLSGMGYLIGIHAFWIVLGEVLGVAVCWILLNQRFKALSDQYEAITVTDVIADRLGDKKHLIRLISTLALLIFITAYVSAQFAATGKAFHGFLGTSHVSGVLIGVVIVGFYTIAGGFFAVVWSDFVQGGLMLLGLFFVPLVAIVAAGGPTEVVSALKAINPDLIDVWGAGGLGWRGVLSAAGMTAIGLGFLGSPQLFVRFISVKNREELTKGSIVAVAFTAISGVGAVAAGMAGRALTSAGGLLGEVKIGGATGVLLSDPEQIFPLLATELFPVLLTGLIIAVVLAAIMSTADSLLVLLSSALVRDYLQRMMGVELDEKRITKLCRHITFFICMIAILPALDPQSKIFWFVLFAWTGITSAFCPVIILSLFWKRLSVVGAAAGMLAGLGLTILWRVIPLDWLPFLADFAVDAKIVAAGKTGAASLHNVIDHMLIAFGAATITAVVVSLFTDPPENAERDLATLKANVIDVWDRQ